MREEILIVDDEDIISDSLKEYLSGRGYVVETADNLFAAKEIIKKRFFDLILLDLKLPDGLGIELLTEMSKMDDKPIVIVMTAYGTIENAVTAMKLGAYDFIQKPFRTKDIELIVKLALETKKLDREVRQLLTIQAEKYGIKNIIAKSKKMLEIFDVIKKIARTGANAVLILGESGTGKELIAKALHYESKRAIWPFVAINCSAIPPHLLESELYGHEKGAFTDAKERKIGLFEKANKGTLLLDEIGDMTTDLQTKLLRTLEDKKIRRIGGTEDILLDVQIIAATNQDLEGLVKEGKFRKDLYYRLKVIEIKVPPLRERKEDIELLLKYFLNCFNVQTGKKFKGVSDEALKLFLNYDYPGNVRELKNIVEKIVILEEGDYVLPEHLPSEITGEAKKEIEGQHFKSLEEIAKEGFTDYIGGIERAIILEALKVCGGNKSETAKLLKLDRSTLRYKMKQYGVKE
ncbi:MAG: sigma-54 dependent transcriptional regulator [bacterium]